MNAYESDYGPCPSVINIERETMTNDSFRVAVWTGEYAQMILDNCKKSFVYKEDLTLNGLYSIYKINVDNNR